MNFTTSDFTGYKCKTGARYLEGKLMGYGNFKSDITGYRVGKSFSFFQLEIKRYGISNLGQNQQDVGNSDPFPHPMGPLLNGLGQITLGFLPFS